MGFIDYIKNKKEAFNRSREKSIIERKIADRENALRTQAKNMQLQERLEARQALQQEQSELRKTRQALFNSSKQGKLLSSAKSTQGKLLSSAKRIVSDIQQRNQPKTVMATRQPALNKKVVYKTITYQQPKINTEKPKPREEFKFKL